MTRHTKVLAGPAGHWYALINGDGGDFLVGLPMNRDDDENDPPPHPDISGNEDWYEITDPAPETETEAIIASLREPTPTSYLVRIVSGPAAGYEYVATVPPEETIVVAPNPRVPQIDHQEWSGSRWMRVPRPGPPWPGERRYKRGPLPDSPAPVGILTEDGDIIVPYEQA